MSGGVKSGTAWQWPPNVPDKVIGWSATGRELENKDPASVIGFPIPAVADTFLYRNAGNTAYEALTVSETRNVLGSLTFGTRALAAAFSPVTAPDYIRTAGFAAAGDGGQALYRQVVSEPTHAGKFSITLPDLTVVWYEIAESILNERMFGAPCDGEFDASTAVGTDATAILQSWADCPVSKRKRFTGVSRITETVTFPAGTILEGDGHHTGVTGKQIVTYTGASLVLLDGSSDFTATSELGANATKGDTRLTLVSTAGLSAGDYVVIYNPTDQSWAVFTGRLTYRAGEWVRIQKVVDATTINLMGPLFDSYLIADVDLFVMRGAQVVCRDFRVETPVVDNKAGLKITSIVQPVVDNVRLDGLTEYAGGVMERCVDIRLDGSAYQGDDPTSNNEYGWIISSCQGGEIHGVYYAMRHGIAFGNSDFVGCVPNRSITVYANTHNNGGAGSIEMGGHGNAENLTLIGGTHSGLSFGGKNMRYVNCKFRKGLAWADAVTGGLCASGSEFVGGDIVFDNCEFEAFTDSIAGAGGPAPINVTLLAGVKEVPRFFFNNCRFRFDPATVYGIRIQINGCTFEPQVYVNGGHVIEGAGLTQFLRLQSVSGANVFSSAHVNNLVGLNATALGACVSLATATVTSLKEPPIKGTLSTALAALADGAGEAFNVTVTGAVVNENQYVTISYSSNVAGRQLTGAPSAVDTVLVRVQNETAASLGSIASGTLAVLLHRDMG